MDIALAHLLRQGLESFYPRIRVQRVIRGKKQWVIRPMFPNYIFARFSLVDHYRPVRATRGVSRVVSFGGKPPAVPPEVIDQLKSEKGEGRIVQLKPEEFRRGEKIKVIEGPFAGFSAVFKSELKDRDRVIILLNLLKTAVRSEIPRDSITKE